MKRIVFVLMMCLSAAGAGAQELMLQNSEKELQQLMDRMFNSRSDNERFHANEQFLTVLDNALEYGDSFYYPFDSLSGISILTSPDKQFRIFTWAVFSSEGSYDNFGYIQAKNASTDEYETYRLWDRSDDIFNVQEEKLSDTMWLGAVYYDLIQIKEDGKTYYTLLGWDGKDIYSKRKIIEPVSFRRNSARPVFGASVFYRQKNLKRMVFEYAPTTAFNLKWDNQYYTVKEIRKAKGGLFKKARPFQVEEQKTEKEWMIVYDELEPMYDGVGNFEQLYVPSGSVVGLRFENGRWRKVENLVPRNAKKKNEQDNGNYDYSNQRRLY